MASHIIDLCVNECVYVCVSVCVFVCVCVSVCVYVCVSVCGEKVLPIQSLLLQGKTNHDMLLLHTLCI